MNTNMFILQDIFLKYKGTSILKDINLSIIAGETVVITGLSGSGKTTLAKIFSGEVEVTKGTFVNNSTKSILVSQQDNFSAISGQASTYYSQRYEMHDIKGLPDVMHYLQQVVKKAEIAIDEMSLENIIDKTNIRKIISRKLMQLSNGERKRTQLAAALLQKPDVLLLDQPFVGLDVASRALLNNLLEEIAASKITLVLICSPSHIPSFANTVVTLTNGEISQIKERESYVPVELKETVKDYSDKLKEITDLHTNEFNDVVKMTDVNVSLAGKHILKDINWHVKNGDCWALIGHNGAGKTTLLSLITADNPQGYNNDLILFDKQRGSGESVWDIKQKIGFVSPELHLYFLRGKGVLNTIPGISSTAESYSTLSCLDIIVSGFNDEIGFVTNPNKVQLDLAKKWLEILGLEKLENSLFAHASLGEQRALLLARALVKSPTLLILDEPCQGMDELQISHFKNLLNHVCTVLQTTLIYVSHYANEIPEVVNKVLKLDSGVVVENTTLSSV
ncbi:ATP-binding cassette domain-containing protein [Zhouia sp. PK063]|uniref:ATP-binding cassette domain-containing protein n=1 Tax=Zhouia sp. PK063 TaxID=3373602 RepID=UPI0037B1E904